MVSPPLFIRILTPVKVLTQAPVVVVAVMWIIVFQVCVDALLRRLRALSSLRIPVSHVSAAQAGMPAHSAKPAAREMTAVMVRSSRLSWMVALLDFSAALASMGIVTLIEAMRRSPGGIGGRTSARLAADRLRSARRAYHTRVYAPGTAA